MSEWIDCNERMPEEEKRVLILEHGNIEIAELWDENKYDRSKARTRKDKYPVSLIWTANCNSFYNVTHWMPLPEPPPVVEYDYGEENNEIETN